MSFTYLAHQKDKIEEHQLVSLTKAIPAEGLSEGVLGTIVHLCSDGRACEVEFVSDTGSKVVTLILNQIEPFKIKNWMPNISGSRVLGLVHEVTGAALSEKEPIPYHKFEATNEEAKEIATIIRNNLDKLPPVYKRSIDEALFEGSYEDFLEWVEEWCNWCFNCNGYKIT